jgi:hypothetical protein
MNFNCYKQGENPSLSFIAVFHRKSIAFFWGVLLFFLTPSVLEAQCVAGETGGTIWRDFNNDGIKDAAETFGVSGVTVKAYNSTGTLAGTTTTNASGQYTFGVLSPTPTLTAKYRIEFSNLPPQYQPTFNGINGRTDVQFITSAACDINFGMVNPTDYCQNDPQMAIACYAVGKPSDLPEPIPALVSDNFANRNGVLVGAQPTHDVVLATVQQIGSVYGLGFSKKTGRVYAASFMKRLTAFGNGNGGADGSTGAIYSMLPDGSGLQVLIDLPASEIGTNPHPTTTTDFTKDPSWDEVGKISWGDIEVSDDGLHLWAMNLYNRKLYKIDLNTGVVVNSWLIPGITGGPAFTGCSATQADRDKDLRPFALREKNGKVYVGVTCTGESAVPVGTELGTSTALKGFIFEFDVTTSAFNTVPVLDFPMSNPLTGSMNEHFRAWKSDFVGGSFNYYERSPRPWLVDLDFVGDDLIIGIRNRSKDQLPALDGTFGPAGNDNTAVNGIGGGGSGRVVRAFKSGSSWTLESSTNFQAASMGNNFYEQDVQHADEGDYMGGIVYNPATGEIAAPATIGADAGGFAYIQSSTNTWRSTPNNLYSTVYLSYPTIPGAPIPFLFGKANGLGEPLLICSNEPIQIGNYVWHDQNKDGVQDPNEPPLSNVTVTLWKNGTQIASTITNGSGEYYFSSKYLLGATWTGIGVDTTLMPNMAYELRIETTQTGISTPNYALTTTNGTANNGNDQNDNDASISGNYAVITFTTGAAGSTNHTLDFGFYPCPYISNPSAAQTVCEGASGSNITVTTNQNNTNGIKFVKFTSDQIAGATPTAAELIAIYAGTAISSVTPTGASSPFTATYTWSSADFPNATTSPITHYVYTILNPDLGASCRPVQEIRVTVNPLVVSGTASNITLCNNATSVIDLASLLTGEDAGGTWTRVSGTGGTFNAGAGSFTPSSGVTNSIFRYTVTGTSPCPNQTTDVTITFQNCCPSNNCGTISISKN